MLTCKSIKVCVLCSKLTFLLISSALGQVTPLGEVKEKLFTDQE